jgi:hypothetical protein
MPAFLPSQSRQNAGGLVHDSNPLFKREDTPNLNGRFRGVKVSELALVRHFPQQIRVPNLADGTWKNLKSLEELVSHALEIRRHPSMSGLDFIPVEYHLVREFYRT